jgi:uncharacterized protein (TIGR01777 family)
MKILISGSTGLIGHELVNFLQKNGHSIGVLVRKKKKCSDSGCGCPCDKGSAGQIQEIFWNPDTGEIDRNELEGYDGVVHLAGESIAEGRWNAAKKQRILESRVKGTELLCSALSQLKSKPKIMVSSSAIGFYGSRADEELSEKSTAGEGFLADVCKKWESATVSAKNAGIRVVNLRTGMVLSKKGGALGKMLFPFKMGLGGVIGSGKQWMSWIGIDDLVGLIDFALQETGVVGPLNGVAPNPVTNREFTKSLGKVLGRPTIFPMPGFIAKIAFGEMADALLLSSTRVVPSEAIRYGYRFKWNRLEECLAGLLNRE